MRNKVFLDTSYAIALSVESDSNHDKALELAASLESGPPITLVTTRAIVLEIGNALSKPHHREAAVRLLSALENDPNVEIAEITDELYQQGFSLFESRPDKSWGLIDCISFALMNGLDFSDSLTADKHFEQAGFRALLRGPVDPVGLEE